MKIFIAHAQKDSRLAARLAARLSKEGFTVWEAEREIGPGDNWAKEVGRALDESNLMVAVVTDEALQSEWWHSEIQYALTAKSFERRIIPVFVSVTSAVPWILLQMVHVTLESESQGFEEVLSRVREIEKQETNAPC
jgi:hypothetical protein